MHDGNCAPFAVFCRRKKTEGDDVESVPARRLREHPCSHVCSTKSDARRGRLSPSERRILTNPTFPDATRGCLLSSSKVPSPTSSLSMYIKMPGPTSGLPGGGEQVWLSMSSGATYRPIRASLAGHYPSNWSTCWLCWLARDNVEVPALERIWARVSWLVS